MKIGVVSEVKPFEYRVALLPDVVEQLTANGHEVLFQSGAANGVSLDDQDYVNAGATVVEGAATVWNQSEMVVKVKEPQKEEISLIREGQILFGYLHLAASRELTEDLLATGCTGLAFETLEDDKGALPLLMPMSEIAGRIAVQEGSKYLGKPFGGRGVLIGGIPGTPSGITLIIGGGSVGINAARMAAGLGSMVYILEKNPHRLRYLADVLPANVQVLNSTSGAVAELLPIADLVVSSILIHGARPPKLIKRNDLSRMKKGAVIVDVAIDQGGSTETSRPTTHHEPIYLEEGIVHYCVANMPGSMPITSSRALSDTLAPYVVKLANHPNPNELYTRGGAYGSALNVHGGQLYCEPVAETFDMKMGKLLS